MMVSIQQSLDWSTYKHACKNTYNIFQERVQVPSTLANNKIALAPNQGIPCFDSCVSQTKFNILIPKRVYFSTLFFFSLQPFQSLSFSSWLPSLEIPNVKCWWKRPIGVSKWFLCLKWYKWRFILKEITWSSVELFLRKCHNTASG